MEESIYSDHFSSIGMLIIPIITISTYFLGKVVSRSALMTAVFDRYLYFVLSIPSLSWIYN